MTTARSQRHRNPARHRHYEPLRANSRRLGAEEFIRRYYTERVLKRIILAKETTRDDRNARGPNHNASIRLRRYWRIVQAWRCGCAASIRLTAMRFAIVPRSMFRQGMESEWRKSRSDISATRVERQRSIEALGCNPTRRTPTQIISTALLTRTMIRTTYLSSNRAERTPTMNYIDHYPRRSPISFSLGWRDPQRHRQATTGRERFDNA